MNKFDKHTHCEYCEEEMVSKNRNKRFCSDKCRTYYNRENKKPTKKPQEIKENKIKTPLNTYNKKPEINDLKKLIAQPPSKNWLNNYMEDPNNLDGISDPSMPF